jgi:hypothetical protein
MGRRHDNDDDWAGLVLGVPIGVVCSLVVMLAMGAVYGLWTLCRLAWKHARSNVASESARHESAGAASGVALQQARSMEQAAWQPAVDECMPLPADVLDERGARSWHGVLVDCRQVPSGDAHTWVIELADAFSGERCLVHGQGLRDALDASAAQAGDCVTVELCGYRRLLHDNVPIRRKVWAVHVMQSASEQEYLPSMAGESQ